ncbi:MFS transporter [Gorillibacterium timonense]|uniref:MFS transporter n=1 Tax=Gorillibacterium timonense TaxID=1689269 RepID=UPI00071C6785|nr:MFS transporter [Gorillibacterium timonense]
MWRNRNVWIVLTGEFIAGLGLWTATIANLEFMQRLVPSDFLKSVILFVGLFAGVLLGPLAGRIIDTTRKKTVLLYAGIGRLLSLGLMFIALATDSIAWMVAFMIALQIAAAFFFPALQAVLPIIVPEKQLITLNGAHMNASTLSRILGTALAGIMLTVMSLTDLYLVSVAGYAFLVVATFFLHTEEEEKGLHVAKSRQTREGSEEGTRKEASSKPDKSGFKEMIPLLKGMPMVAMLLLLAVIPTLFIGGFNLMVIGVSELQHDSTIKGILYAAEGTSFIVGAFLVKRLSSNGPLLRRLLLFAFLVAIAHLSLFFGDSKPFAIASFALFGFSAGCFYPLIAAYFQTEVPREYHGRFFSFRNMLDRVLTQVILLSTGFFLDTIGLQWMAVVFGSLSMLMVLTATRFSRRFFGKGSSQQVEIDIQ